MSFRLYGTISGCGRSSGAVIPALGSGRYSPGPNIVLSSWLKGSDPNFTITVFWGQPGARATVSKNTPIFVLISNPPYNARQVNENDNNKNRKYPVIDKRVAETYGKSSQATNKNALSDVYVKALRLAFDRIGNEGIIAYITNNSFVDDFAFDGMRGMLTQECDAMYILNLGGNVRKNPKLSGTTHNVFGIQVGVSINLFVKKESSKQKRQAKIYYASTDEYWRKDQKCEFLDNNVCSRNIEWTEVNQDNKYNWIKHGLIEKFDTFIPVGTKERKISLENNSIFTIFSNGVKTNRDVWAYNFNQNHLRDNVRKTVEFYNSHISKWVNNAKSINIDDFVISDYEKINWSESLKNYLDKIGYNGFCGSCSTPFMEPETSKFSSQLSA